MLAWGSSALLNCLPCGTNATRLAHLHLWARGGLKGGGGVSSSLRPGCKVEGKGTYPVADHVYGVQRHLQQGSKYLCRLVDFRMTAPEPLRKGSGHTRLVASLR